MRHSLSRGGSYRRTIVETTVPLMEGSASHTDWSLVNDAGQNDDSRVAAVALEQLVRRYWPAVYAFIRSTGRDVHEASDLTQGFVCDILISRRLCSGADPLRGRFRSLLLTSVKTYLHERYRHDHRKKRAADRTVALRMDESERAVVDRAPARSPEQAFSYEWSATLVRRVLEQVREECERDELGGHWEVFEHRVVRPMLLGEAPTDYALLVDRLDLKDASQGANMMVTVKRRFAAALYDEVARTVDDPGDIQDELNQLLIDLERP